MELKKKKKVMSVVDAALKIYTFPINAVLKRLPSANRRSQLKGELFKHLYTGSEYGMISFYPKSTESMQIHATDQDFANTAIVLQGPVVLQDHFTVNTVKMYKQYYKNVHVIVSTWKNTPEEEAEALRTAGAVVILNEYPKENYYWNLNYQLTSSLAGVKKAKELCGGIEYICKTRTDQRYYNPCALAFLLCQHQRGKITLLGAVHNSHWSSPFLISDFFAFGEADDIELLYSCDFDTQENQEASAEIYRSQSYKQLLDRVQQTEADGRIKIPLELEKMALQLQSPEIKIAYQYFCRKTDISQYVTPLDAYNDFLRRYVNIADANTLGFYWFKYKWQAYAPTYFERGGKLDMAKWYALFGQEE